MSVSEALPDDFFKEDWQRRPRHLPGFANAVVPSLAADPSAVRSLIESDAASRGDGRTIWFRERVRDDVPEVARLCADAAVAFEWDDVWCDLFATRGRASIGRHFDDSDNISIQLAGTKHWRLRPPGTISSSARRLRAIGEPGVGGLPEGIGADDVVWVVGPGDALYIPSMWSHEGVSEHDSVSVSLVVNVATVLHAVLPELLRHVRTSPHWTQVLATGPGSVTRRRAQLDAVAGPDATAALLVSLGAASTAAVSVTNSPRREPPPVQIDLDWLRSYIASGPEMPSAGLVRIDPEASAALGALAARRSLKRFVKALVVGSQRTSERRALAVYAAVTALLPRLAAVELDHLMTDPQVTSWTSAALSAASPAASGARSMVDPAVDVLAIALLPELVAHHHGEALLVHPPVDIDGGVTLHRWGLRVDATKAPVTLLVSLGHADVVGPRPLAAIVEPLPSIHGASLCRAASEWFAEHAPAGAAVHAVDALGSAEIASCLRAAVDLLDEHYPAAGIAFRSDIRTLLPLPSTGHRANNYSLPMFRGLIATSAREPYMVAQALAHETAHNQVNSLLEVARLCMNPTEQVISPVVRAARPLTALFHGCVAFAQDVQLSRALIAVGHADRERIGRYLSGRIATIAETVEILRGTAELTPLGEAIIAEISEVLVSADPR